MTAIDYVVLVAYFLVMAGIGFLCMLKVKKQEDYFLGGRAFGKIFQTFAAFGAGTGANDPVVVGRATYTSGFAGIWTVLCWLLVTPFYWIAAVWYRRMRHLTLGDWFVERFENRGLGAAYSVFGIVYYMIYLSVAFAAVAKVCEPLIAPDTVELDTLRWILVPVIAFVVIVYGVLGGLRAAYWTDLIQGVFIILLSVLLIPFGLELLVERYPDPAHTGILDGFKVMHDQVPPRFFEITGNEFPLYYVVCIFLLNLVGIVVQPHFIATGGGSAKTENSARVGLVLGNFLKRFCTVGWALTGLIMLALLSASPELGSDPDKVWGLAAVEILGPLKIGLVGLMVACLLAALMSSADCYMLVSSALVVRNVYAAYLHREASEKQCVFVGRIVGVVIIVGAAAFALSSYNVLDQLKFAWEIPLLFAAPFWIGMFWRRATTWAAWGTVLFSTTVFFVLPIVLPIAVPDLRGDPRFAVTNDMVTTKVERTASPSDVAHREVAIASWKKAREAAVAETDVAERDEALEKLGAAPEPLALGATFTETKKKGGRAVFWFGGLDRDLAAEAPKETVSSENGVTVERYVDGSRQHGKGIFNLDFILWEAVGVKLRSLPDPAIDALRLPTRVVVPFFVMVFLSLITPRNRKESLDRYYVKMKTPTEPDPEEDRRELELSYEDPQRFDHKKLLPNTGFELQRPTTGDVVGVVLSCLGVVGIIALVVWVAGIGA